MLDLNGRRYVAGRGSDTERVVDLTPEGSVGLESDGASALAILVHADYGLSRRKEVVTEEEKWFPLGDAELVAARGAVKTEYKGGTAVELHRVTIGVVERRAGGFRVSRDTAICRKQGEKPGSEDADSGAWITEGAANGDGGADHILGGFATASLGVSHDGQAINVE